MVTVQVFWWAPYAMLAWVGLAFFSGYQLGRKNEREMQIFRDAAADRERADRRTEG